MKDWNCQIIPGNRHLISDVFFGNFAFLCIRFAFISFLFLAGSPISLAGQLQAQDQPSISLEAPKDSIRVGERLDFHGRWMGIPVGYGSLEVKELTEIDGRPAYHVVLEAHSNDFLSSFYPINDIVHSYIDAETLRPLRFEKKQHEGRYRSDEVVSFDYDKLLAYYHSNLNGSKKEIPITADVHDIVSAFYWLRLQTVKPGEPISLKIYSDEKVFETEIDLVKTLKIELLKRGTFPCLLVEPKASFKGIFVTRGKMLVYISADSRRIPLFVKIVTPWGLMTGVIDSKSL